MSPAYQLILEAKHWKALEGLPRDVQREDATEFLMNYVAYHPTKRMANGKLKELRGEHKGRWQYDIDQDYRIVYTIDEAQKQILVQYIGYHPAWGTKQGQRIRP